MDRAEIAEWLTAFGTIGLAVVAAFQDKIREVVWRPRLAAAMRMEPPDCKAVPIQIDTPAQSVKVNSIYLRLRVINNGNAPAKNVEVYAETLDKCRRDGAWERVMQFPPMNLIWSDINQMYFPSIAPGMGKHCDIAAIPEPAGIALVEADGPLKAAAVLGETRLDFCLISKPNHRGNTVGPGQYRLTICLAAENAKPVRRRLLIQLGGKWDERESEMLKNGVDVSIEAKTNA